MAKVSGRNGGTENQESQVMLSASGGGRQYIVELMWG